MKKFELDKNDFVKVDGSVLYRIVALKDFSDVKKGDKGGYVEYEENLSHEGDCWVYDGAHIFGDSLIKDSAKVYGKYWVIGATLSGHTELRNLVF